MSAYRDRHIRMRIRNQLVKRDGRNKVRFRKNYIKDWLNDRAGFHGISWHLDFIHMGDGVFEYYLRAPRVIALLFKVCWDPASTESASVFTTFDSEDPTQV